MDAESFNIILHEISPLIIRQNTRLIECISGAKYLSVIDSPSGRTVDHAQILSNR